MWPHALLAALILGVPQNVTLGTQTCTVRVSSREQPERKRASSVFSATEIVDLRFDVTFPTLAPGEHKLELQVLTPRGHLYQSLVVPFVRGPAGRERFKQVTAPLPVAGTSIMTSSLYGRWRVVPYVDSLRTSCAAPQSFTLKR